MQIAFSPELYEYLKVKGYSHFYAIGNRIAEGQPDHEDYVLVPLLPDDPRINYEESDVIIYEIDADDVKDMIQGDEFINFYVELSMEVFSEFKQL
jgi:hypothetical protein